MSEPSLIHRFTTEAACEQVRKNVEFVADKKYKIRCVEERNALWLDVTALDEMDWRQMYERSMDERRAELGG